MKQAIAGVAPRDLGEVTNMVVWPSVGASPVGRWLGSACSVRAGVGFFTLGKLFALLLIPVGILLYLKLIFPGLGSRYRLTNRRVIEEKSVTGKEVRSVALDQFDQIAVQVLPGQEWFPCGELIFKNEGVVTFHLSGVKRPETFRHTCLKARQSYVGVQQALAHQAGQV